MPVINEQLLEIFQNKSVAIAGFGVEGRAAYEFLQQIDCAVTIIDENPKTTVPDGVAAKLGDEWLHGIEGYDVVLRTSGMHPDKLSAAQLVTTSTDLLLKVYGRQTLALTGTKGKTTTVKLINQLLLSTGSKVELIGNVGRSAWEILATEVEPATAIVAELSSFQLSDAKHSPHIAGLLPITADHMDWHSDEQDYEQSKLNLIRFSGANDTVIADRSVISNLNVANITSANVKPTDEFISQESTRLMTSAGEIEVGELKLKGQHNVDDIKLAFSMTLEWLHKHGQTLSEHWESLRRTIYEFEPLAYHMEPLGKIDGVQVINDSYASNPTAALAAINSVAGKKVLIVGGHSKGLPMEQLFKSFDQQQVEAAVIIGADEQQCADLAAQIAKFAKTTVDVVGEQDISTILERALQLADERTTILLSPAHASFDMYKNFNERGKLFTEAVRERQK